MTEKNHARGVFPPTRRSAVLLVGSDDPAERARSFDVLVRAYWKPAYKHLRLRFGRPAEDASDLIQSFFSRAFEKRWFASYDPSKGRFRTYFKTCLDRHAMETDRHERRQKRGGDAVKLSLDFEGAERELELAEPVVDVEAQFDREWTRQLLEATTRALEELCRGQGKEVYFEVFRRSLLVGDSSYREIAEALGLRVSQVTNFLAWTRRHFRRLAIEELRAITASEEELEEETRALFGGAAP
ncbi:MAG: sigma-70 family RNA polymerase sigma factor [Myxococcales bacterium]|nr:sigma-70 family RNA polymerase sigma factor [Myxococcales bacterium]